jgi:hypothetical protein
MDDNRLKNLTTHFEELKRKREPWERIWVDIDRFVRPQTASKSNNKQVFDSTAIWCRMQLASGLQMLLVNPSYTWFSLDAEHKGTSASPNSEDPPTENPDLRLWRDEVQSKIYRVFANPFNNFYNQVRKFFLSLTGRGAAVFYIEEVPELPDLMFFRSLDLKECFFEENQFGRVETMHRFFSFPASIAVQKWPKDAVFKKMVLENRGDEKVEILHVVRKETLTKKGFAYESIYMDFAHTRLIEERGYDYFPFLVARWMVEDSEGCYGSAPGEHVMPDIKLLHTLRQDHIKIMQKALDPPLLVPENGYHLPLSITPGSINFYRNGIADPIRPVSPMENIQISFEEMAQCRDAIMKAFYIDLFRMGKESKEMTVPEVQIRSEEQMRLMGAIIGGIEAEFFNPLILAVYHILAKYGRIERFPKGDRDNGQQNLNICYNSVFSIAQKSAAYNSTEGVLGFLQRSGIANICPEIYDNVNWDKVFTLFVELKDVPQGILNTEEEKIQIRQKRTLQIEQMQQLQGGMR